MPDQPVTLAAQQPDPDAEVRAYAVTTNTHGVLTRADLAAMDAWILDVDRRIADAHAARLALAGVTADEIDAAVDVLDAYVGGAR